MNERARSCVVPIVLQKSLHPSARPAIALGLTFMLVGLSYALPIRLVPASVGKLWLGNMPTEVLNVYACVAWAGWAHFLYAFRGQAQGLKRMQFGARRELLYLAALAASLSLLVGLRSALGVTLFGAVVWATFIDHFIKAERAFDGVSVQAEGLLKRWLASYRSVFAFAWVSVVLLNMGDVDHRRWTLIGVSIAVTFVELAGGGWKELASGHFRGPLLSLFFIGEALVWGTFSAYGGPVFLTGVYIFHIAAASYFHYLGSYLYAFERTSGVDRLLTPLAVVGVNLGVVIVGWGAAKFEWLGWLTPIIGIQWFTLWVAVHLVSSELLPMFKRRQAAKVS